MPRTTPAGFQPHYHELHRAGRPGAWRSIVGALLLPLLVFVVVPVVVALGVLVGLLASGQSMEEATAALDVTREVTPVGLAVLNLTLAAGIPSAWLVMWLMHRLKPGWLSSIAPRIRWRFLVACLGVSVIALVATLLVSFALPTADVTGPTGELNDFTTQTRDFLLVIVLLTPLQAAGEEYVFRGYLTQAFGSLFARPDVARVLAVVGPALLFALAHGSQSLPVFFDRFAFGVVAGILVIRTGGLEAAIAMHVLNNFVAFGLALAYADMTETLLASAPASWWMILSTLTQSLVYLGLASWVASRMRITNVGPATGAVLEPSAGRV